MNKFYWLILLIILNILSVKCPIWSSWRSRWWRRSWRLKVRISIKHRSFRTGGSTHSINPSWWRHPTSRRSLISRPSEPRCSGCSRPLILPPQARRCFIRLLMSYLLTLPPNWFRSRIGIINVCNDSISNIGETKVVMPQPLKRCSLSTLDLNLSMRYTYKHHHPKDLKPPSHISRRIWPSNHLIRAHCRYSSRDKSLRIILVICDTNIYSLYNKS